MNVLVCGDRNWTNRKAIKNALMGLLKDTTIINGACQGADKLSTDVARELGFTVQEFPANWIKLGKVAGPVRNQDMIDIGSPDLVIAFHSDIANSKGTLDMCKRARKANIPVILIGE